MEKKYKITYLPLFYKDLVKITDYMKYTLKNNIVANNFVDKVENEIKKRAYNPEAYEKHISNKKRKTIYYKIYINNYTIFYTVKNEIMEIRRILYSKRNFNNML